MTRHRITHEVGPGRNGKMAHSYRCSCRGFSLTADSERDGRMAAQVHLDNHPEPDEEAAA